MALRGRQLQHGLFHVRHRLLPHGFGSHWPPLNATEFTPKDVYQLALYADNTAPRFTAASCPTLVSSPRGSYCQIVGDIKLVRLYF